MTVRISYTDEQFQRIKREAAATAYAYGRLDEIHRSLRPAPFVSSVEFTREVMRRGTKVQDFPRLWAAMEQAAQSAQDVKAAA